MSKNVVYGLVFMLAIFSDTLSAQHKELAVTPVPQYAERLCWVNLGGGEWF